MGAKGPSSPSGWCFFVISCCILVVGRSQIPQVNTNGTEPSEVTALIAIFKKWGLQISWNTTSDPCSGHALDETDIESELFNPLIKCECDLNGSPVCHITKLKVTSKSVDGPIPAELRNLTFLSNLKLSKNHLTGSLPSSLGDFPFMQFLTFGTNSLTGTIPKEIGKLQRLQVLGLGSNGFSGSLPPELGNLPRLEQLYIDSSGVSGEIPQTFAKLRNLRILWASGNNLTGKVPPFLGELKNLQDLRLQGNALKGPIPSSFVNLTQLSNLRIGEITEAGSSLDFIKEMRSLTTLVIRNAKLSGNIPTNIAEYKNLSLLDLSFNSLTGSIPESLFSLNQLNYLFLGNNSFSGSLPKLKSASLRSIDLSYNNLSGEFPTWLSESNLQVNLVANNFVLDDSNNRILPQGLHCLQNSFSCFRGSPVWSSFAVNCGGNLSVTSTDGLTYEMDSNLPDSPSYYISADMRWAVSNVGRFLDATTGAYVVYDSSTFPNTLDTTLFQSSRLSPSSLRYYGLGLENGKYNVKLQFVESTFSDPPYWYSIGRRVFDVYIQGILVLKDFDIKKEAGQRFRFVISREFTANVKDNFLEIHFFWAGKGTCCIPSRGFYGPSISAIGVTADFPATVSNRLPGSSSGKKKRLIVGLAVGVTMAAFAVLIYGLYIWRQKKLGAINGDEDELRHLATKSEIFTYAELKLATEDFCPANKLGEGGFGSVFKGKLSDGRIVAVKQLSPTSDQGKKQFVTEIDTISSVRHKNLVKLYGCCCEGNMRLIVYEYLENSSLDKSLFGDNYIHIDWPSRFNICLGTARGLAYLHAESNVIIIHRDVKASNILLDTDLNPKISDFGLARLFVDGKSHLSTRVAGTFGYLAPEYALLGHLTEKVDVFGFGVVALEIVSGRAIMETSFTEQRMHLVGWAWHLHENDLEYQLVDPKLKSYDIEEAIRMIRVGLLCTQGSPLLRPSMSKVVSMMAGDIPLAEITSKPNYLTEWNLGDISSIAGSNVPGPHLAAVRTSDPSTSSYSSSMMEQSSTLSPSQPLVKSTFQEEAN